MFGLTAEERKAIYCHELGHCFSHNQQESKGNERNICDEVDSDTFAVEQCGISPYIKVMNMKLEIQDKKRI